MGFKAIEIKGKNGELLAQFSSRPWDVFGVETADDGFCITRKRFLRKKKTIACFTSESSLDLEDCKLCRIVNPLMR